MDYFDMTDYRYRSSFYCLVILIFLLSGCEEILTGPEGDDPRSKIAGLWLCDESSSYLKSAAETYYVEIDLHPRDSSKVVISNFFNVNDDAEATLSNNRLTLPGQTLEGGFTISGSGAIGKNYTEINWVYFVNDGSGENNKVTAVYTKQE
jgi:hypothetical protein